MPPVGAAHCRDRGRVTRSRKPVVNRSADLAALHGWLAGTMMTGDQKQDPVAAGYCLVEAAING